jgi:hypothetical protein
LVSFKGIKDGIANSSFGQANRIDTSYKGLSGKKRCTQDEFRTGHSSLKIGYALNNVRNWITNISERFEKYHIYKSAKESIDFDKKYVTNRNIIVEVMIKSS